jgi:hypothetical protein
MSNDELRKLIGGYATGNLTTEERRALYHAALDDQELFDVLSDEQPLKDLLDDDESRREVERALRDASAPRRTSWFTWPWTWAAVGSLAAGVALIALLVNPRASKPGSPNIVVTSPQIAPQPEPPAKVEIFEKRAERRPRSTKSAKAAAVPPPASVTNTEIKEADARNNDNLSVNATSQAAPLQKRAIAPAALAIPPFAYTILKQSPDGASVPLNAADLLQVGDQLQFRVQPRGAGTLTISEQEPNGEWSALADVKVGDPQKVYTLPPAPVHIGESIVLRLELVGEETQAKTPSSRRVEITLTPGRRPAVK